MFSRARTISMREGQPESRVRVGENFPKKRAVITKCLLVDIVKRKGEVLLSTVFRLAVVHAKKKNSS